MSPIDYALAFLLVAAVAFALGRKTAPTTITNTDTTNEVTITLPHDAAKLDALDMDHPAVTAAMTLPLAKAKVWLRAYELAVDNCEDYPEDHADRAVQACFD